MISRSRTILSLALAILLVSAALCPLAKADASSSISTNFNATAIAGGNSIWFNSVLKPSGIGSSPVTVFIRKSTITFSANGTNYSVAAPDANITFSPSATTAIINFDSTKNQWQLTVPSSGLAGNTFLDAVAFPVPQGGLPGGIKNVKWQANFSTDTAGISLQWKWGAAVYTSFNTSYNSLGVKPVDDTKASQYKNSDFAGTPENYKTYVVGGATGGGAANYTGGYSGTVSVTVPVAQSPTANPGGPYSSSTGQSISFDGTASTDPDGYPLTYSWNFGDSSIGTGATPSHAYSSAGTFTVTLTVNDGRNVTGTATTTASITLPPPPQISASQYPPPNASGWNNTGVTVSFTCVDTNVGIYSCTPPITITSQGANQVIQGTAVNNAGESTSTSVHVSIDGTAPTVTAVPAPAPNNNGWNNTAVTVSFSCSDSLSGVASCPSSQTVSAEGAGQTIVGTATDNAGNSASTSLTLNIDQTAPVVSITAPANGAVFTASMATVSGTVSDALSGVAALTCNGTAAIVSNGSFSCGLQLVSGLNTIQVRAVDLAGNTSTSSVSVTFNAVAPTQIFITPTQASMLVGDVRTVNLVGQVGQLVSGATWSISDATVVSMSSSDPPQLSALAQGTVTITASYASLSASMTINVLSGTVLPVGTPVWSSDPIPGNTTLQMIPGNPLQTGQPEVFAAEGGTTNLLRAFSADGRQLWTATLASANRAVQHAYVLKIVPDNAGGVVAWLNNLVSGGQFDALIHVDAYGRNTWEFDSSSSLPATASAQLNTAIYANAQSAQAPESPVGNNTQRGLPLLKSGNDDAQANMLRRYDEREQLLENVKERLGNRGSEVSKLATPLDNGGSGLAMPLANTASTSSSVTVFYSIAIAPDNTVYAEQLYGYYPNYCCDWRYQVLFPSSETSFTQSQVIALDGMTGVPKFQDTIPPSQATYLPYYPTATDAMPTPLSILPDGSVQMVYPQYNINVTGTYSEHDAMQVMSIAPDGTPSYNAITHYDFDFPYANCYIQQTFRIFYYCGSLQPIWLGREVIPDGNGGALASWINQGTGGQTGGPGTGSMVTHLDSSGGSNTYNLAPAPTVTQLFSGQGYYLDFESVLGENNVGITDSSILPKNYGSNGHAQAFDITTGAPQWTYTSPDSNPVRILLATDPGGALLAHFDSPYNSKLIDSLISLDAGGNATTTPLSQAMLSLSYFDSTDLLGVSQAGQQQELRSQSTEVATLLPWTFPDGGPAPARASTLLTKEVTVVGWLDGNQVSSPPISTVSVTTILSFETNFATCGLSVLALTGGDKRFVFTDSDRQWVNGFLLSNSSNGRPGGSGNTIDPAKVASGGDYRLFNHFQARLWTSGSKVVQQRYVGFGNNAIVGKTPDPCGILPPVSGEAFSDNGAAAPTANQSALFQLNEGRVGSLGQKANFTLNWCSTSSGCDVSQGPAFTPWIYSAIRFDATGNWTVQHQIFPTYYVYENGKLVTTDVQFPDETFIQLTSGNSQLKASDVQ